MHVMEFFSGSIPTASSIRQVLTNQTRRGSYSETIQSTWHAPCHTTVVPLQASLRSSCTSSHARCAQLGLPNFSRTNCLELIPHSLGVVTAALRRCATAHDEAK